MSKIHSWANDARKRLGSGRLSRKEYEKAVELSVCLANEVLAAYILVCPGNHAMAELGQKRIAEAMRKVGLI